jgi:hypothetical protein
MVSTLIGFAALLPQHLDGQQLLRWLVSTLIGSNLMATPSLAVASIVPLAMLPKNLDWLRWLRRTVWMLCLAEKDIVTLVPYE